MVQNTQRTNLWRVEGREGRERGKEGEREGEGEREKEGRERERERKREEERERYEVILQGTLLLLCHNLFKSCLPDF